MHKCIIDNKTIKCYIENVTTVSYTHLDVYKRQMPSNELADKSRIFGIKDGQVALILDNQVQEEKSYEQGKPSGK